MFIVYYIGFRHTYLRMLQSKSCIEVVQVCYKTVFSYKITNDKVVHISLKMPQKHHDINKGNITWALVIKQCLRSPPAHPPHPPHFALIHMNWVALD